MEQVTAREGDALAKEMMNVVRALKLKGQSSRGVSLGELGREAVQLAVSALTGKLSRVRREPRKSLSLREVDTAKLSWQTGRDCESVLHEILRGVRAVFSSKGVPLNPEPEPE